MHVFPDRSIECQGGRIATMKVSYARLVELFGETGAPAGELDTDKVSAAWWLSTSEGPAWVYNWLPATDYQPPKTTTQWHIGGSRAEVVSCVAEVLNVTAHTSTGGTRSRNESSTPLCLSVTGSDSPCNQCREMAHRAWARASRCAGPRASRAQAHDAGRLVGD